MSAEAASLIDFSNPSPSAALLGWRLIDVDAEAGAMEVGFDGKPEFRNPAGFIQGGILAAMMDDTMGPCLVLHLKGQAFPTTIDLHTHYLRPVRVGPVSVKAKVTKVGKSITFLEAELFDMAGRLSARATASAALVAGVFDGPLRDAPLHDEFKEARHG